MSTKTKPMSKAERTATKKLVRREKNPVLDRQIKIQKALYEIADAASAVLDMQSFYKKLHRIVGKLMHAKTFYITLYDAATGGLTSPYFADEKGDEPPPPTFIDENNKSLRAHVLLRGETLHVSGPEIEAGRLEGRFEPKGTPAEDWIGVPLKMDSQVIGSLTVQSYQKGLRYQEQDVQLLEFVARHIAVALTRARAIEETRQRNSELAVVNSVQQGLAARLDMQAIYRLVGDKIRETFAADTTFIVFKDDENQLLVAAYYADRRLRRSFSRPYGTGIAEAIIESGTPLLLGSAQEHQKYGAHHVSSPGTKRDRNQSVLGVPIVQNGKAYGAVSVQSYKVNAFDENDLRLLQTLVNSMSVALENARLFEETQQRNAELAVINRVQEGLASKLDMQAIYELIGEKVREVFHVEVVDIVNYDPVANLISMPYSYEKGDRSVFSPREPYGFRRQVIESRLPLLINQNFEELASQSSNPLLTGAWPQSALFVPLLVEGQVKSIISIQDLEHENAFSASDVQLLQTLSNAMAVALENARLFGETERLLKDAEHRAQELATINTVGSALAGELDLNTLIELVGEQIRSVFKADVAFVALLDKENGMIHFPYQYGQEPDSIRLGQGLTSKIIQSGQPLLINEEMDRQRQRMKVKLIGKRARSFLGVPIFVAGEAIGVVSVQSTKREGQFTENDQRLLSTIAANVGIAFQNARLFHETQRLFDAERLAHEQAETLRAVAQALNRSLSLTEVFHLVLTEIQKVIPYDSAGIYQVHGNRRVFVAGRGFANLEVLIGVSFEFNQEEDEIGYLISRSLQPLILEDAPEKYPQYFSTGSHAATKIRGYMAVPIVLSQKLIGMITLDREEPGFYTAEHARLAMAFAAQAASAINNAQLFDETQQRNAELAVINRVQEGLASKLDMQAIYELVGEKIRETFDAQVVSIDTYDRNVHTLLGRYYFEGGRTLSGGTYPCFGFRRHVIEKRQPIIIHEDMQSWMKEYDNPVILGLQPKSAIFIPMIVGDEAIGVISLQNNEQENAFTEADVRLLTTLANSMSVALENARLWEQEKLYRKALERELEIGREIQAGFLPEVLPQIEGWEIAAALMSAREVAGDFYDAFELPDGTLGLVIADVCDKGVGAALFMTLFRSLIRVTANQEYFERMEVIESSTKERLQRAILLTNNYIAETHEESGMFATIFFGILDPRDGKLVYINCGHEPPLILRSGTIYEILRNTGPAVGAIRDSDFDALETQLQAGDILFAYTDGVTDCQGPHGEFFGRQRMLNLLQQTVASSRELVECCQSELRQFKASATQFDDITLLAVRRI